MSRDPTPEEIRNAYRRFAAVEAAGRSPVYAQVAEHVDGNRAALDLLAALPAEKRQPNLFFGAIQYLRGPLDGTAAFDAAVAEQAGEITDVVLTHTTQTNIPARCATLLPALARLPQPLALIEVGASAGLCLYPDRYAYDFGGVRVAAREVEGPVFTCAVDGPVPIPHRPLDVVWRAGLDLSPLDVTDADDRAWLEALVWPGEEHLRDQLRAAVEIARAEPPRLVAGDLVEDLPSLVAEAPDAATVVVFHSAVLAYVRDPHRRERFARSVRGLDVTWLANEAPGWIPGLPADASAAHPPGPFLLCQDARPLARTDPHGSALTWLA